MIFYNFGRSWRRKKARQEYRGYGKDFPNTPVWWDHHFKTTAKIANFYLS